MLGGAISATVGQGGVVTLGATDTVSDADDALGSVTITGLPGDLTSFSGGSYTASSGTWTGTAAQFNALTFNAGGPGTFALSISASTTGAEAGSSSESYTLTVSNIGPLVSGTIGTANEGATVALGLTDAVRDAGDTLGTVTITGLSNDLTQLQWRQLHGEHRDLDRDGDTVQCADVYCGRGRQPQYHDQRDRKRSWRRHHHGELHADRQPGGGRPGVRWRGSDQRRRAGWRGDARRHGCGGR